MANPTANELLSLLHERIALTEHIAEHSPSYTPYVGEMQWAVTLCTNGLHATEMPFSGFPPKVSVRAETMIVVFDLEPFAFARLAAQMN